MAFNQYANLDFDQVKESIKDYLRANSNFTDFDFEGSNLSVLINALAYNTYTTAYNLNMAVNENFLDSATIRENVVSLARNIGYVPRSRRSARARISFIVTNQNEDVTLTLKAGIVCTGSGANSSFIFSIPEDITVNVVDGTARFNNIEVYEGLYVVNNFTVDTTNPNQRYILPNSFIDTNTLRVKVRPNQSSSTNIIYTPVDNIIGVTSTSNIYLLQEVSDERYEILFGDGVIGNKLLNNNYITASYITTTGRDGNGVGSFSLIGRIENQDGAAIESDNISVVSVLEKSRDGDEVESINSVKYYAPRIYSSQYRAVTATDYESVLGYIYPNVESVTAYGGEELVPPEYGKVFISVKPRNGDYLSDFTKRDLLQKLKNYSVAGIIPEFIDLKYLYVELNSFVYYNTSLNDDKDNLKSLIISSLNQYSKSIDVNKFGGRFRYSSTVSLIDDVDSSITSNITRVTMRRNLMASIGNFAQYELCFGNRFHVIGTRYNVISTAFQVSGVTGNVYLADERIDSTNGSLFFFQYTEGGEPTIIKRNVGKVKYDIGEIIIDTVNIIATEVQNNIVEVQAVPESNDVVGLRDLYVKLDMTNTNVTMIEDIISSGENTSGSRLTRESSFVQPKYIRRSNSSVTSANSEPISTTLIMNGTSTNESFTITSSSTTN